ncbi:MAG: hypothetical protein JXQ87_19020 [Bacteroidia bacterium]
MDDNNYIVLNHKPIVTTTFIFALFGTLSFMVFVIGTLGHLLNSFEIPGPLIGFSLLIGTPFCLAWLPASFRSGCELDKENKRFREYEGTFGNKKGEWIEVDESDYVSIIGVNEKILAQGRTSVTNYNMKACKVYFNSNDWHLEILKSSYDHSKEYAKVFSDTFDIEINDVNKTQNLKSGGKGFGQNGSFTNN